MKKPITISLSPNMDSQDVREVARVLVSPTTWRDPVYTQEVQSRLTAHFPGRSIVVTSSGRQALYDALRAYDIDEGDEVILQAFTCIAVPESIIWTGATPVYADIDADTYNLTLESVKARVTPKTKAIIIQHTFGIPGPVSEIIAFAHEHNITVIEDCAHAFGTTIAGQPVGTLGDVAIVSFGRDKMVSSIFGGAAVFKDQQYAQRAQSFADTRPYPPTTWLIQQLLHPLTLALIIPFYFLGIGKVVLVAAQKLRLISKAVDVCERSGQMPGHIQWKYSPALAQTVLRQLDMFSQRVSRRRAIASRYRAALANTDIHLARIPDNTEISWLRFPIQVPNKDTVIAQAKEESIMLGDWYNAALVPANATLSAFHYSPGSCPVAERVARRVVNLPTYPKLTDEQVERVIRTLIRSYEHAH